MRVSSWGFPFSQGKFFFPVALFINCGYKRASERSGRACRGRS